MVPNICFPISQRWRKIPTNGFHQHKLALWKNLSLQYEQNRPKLKYWKIVANEKCITEIGELSSVKNLFWVNHATKNAQKNFKQKTFKLTFVSEKMNRL